MATSVPHYLAWMRLLLSMLLQVLLAGAAPNEPLTLPIRIDPPPAVISEQGHGGSHAPGRWCVPRRHRMAS